MAARQTKGILKRMSDMQLADQKKEKKDKAVGVDMEEQSHHRYSTNKKATVEVTVKVKKRRHSPRDRERDDKHREDKVSGSKGSALYPKGSYGDLLSKGKPISSKEIVAKEWKGMDMGDMGEKIKCCNEGGDHPKSVCHKIPISSDLYLETHTHVVRTSSKSSKSSATATASTTPREEVVQHQPKKNLKTRGERERISSGKKGTGSSKTSSSHKKDSDEGVRDRGRGDDDGDGLWKAKAPPSRVEEVEMEKYVQLQLENEVLRKQATGLLAEVHNSKKQQQQSIATMAELAQFADILRLENEQLTKDREQQQNLQQKLVSAVYENKELKQYLDTLMKKQKDSTVKKDVQMNQLEKIRNVIQEVKSTIQDEIKGIATSDSESMAYRETMRSLDFNISEGGSALLNDSNASEVQRILGSYEDSQIHTLKSFEGLDEIQKLNSSIQEEIQRITTSDSESRISAFCKLQDNK